MFNKDLLTAYYVLCTILGRDAPVFPQGTHYSDLNAPRQIISCFPNHPLSFYIPGLNANFPMRTKSQIGICVQKESSNSNHPHILTNHMAAPDHRLHTPDAAHIMSATPSTMAEKRRTVAEKPDVCMSPYQPFLPQPRHPSLRARNTL